jgi:hypothetical protein
MAVMVTFTLLRTLLFLTTVRIAAHAAPIANSLGEMVRHRSPGWDDEHHSAHYRRWERIEVRDLEKRDGREAGIVRRLFREGTGLGKRDVGLEFEVSVRLMPRDQQRVRDVLREVNDPTHERFRKFLSHDEAMELLS